MNYMNGKRLHIAKALYGAVYDDIIVTSIGEPIHLAQNSVELLVQLEGGKIDLISLSQYNITILPEHQISNDCLVEICDPFPLKQIVDLSPPTYLGTDGKKYFTNLSGHSNIYTVDQVGNNPNNRQNDGHFPISVIAVNKVTDTAIMKSAIYGYPLLISDGATIDWVKG